MLLHDVLGGSGGTGQLRTARCSRRVSVPPKMLLRSHPEPLAGLVSASSHSCECGLTSAPSPENFPPSVGATSSGMPSGYRSRQGSLPLVAIRGCERLLLTPINRQLCGAVHAPAPLWAAENQAQPRHTPAPPAPLLSGFPRPLSWEGTSPVISSVQSSPTL